MATKKAVIITVLAATAVAIVYVLYFGWENRDTSKLSKQDIDVLVIKAKHGDLKAIEKLSSYYESTSDKPKAIYWLQIQANKGDRVAAYHLYYLLTEEKAGDKAKALGYLTKSAESGYPLAQWKLSQIYVEGVVVPKDEQKAKYWLDKSKQSKK